MHVLAPRVDSAQRSERARVLRDQRDLHATASSGYAEMDWRCACRVAAGDAAAALPSKLSTASWKLVATSGAARISSGRVASVGTRIGRAPAASAASTSAP